MGNKELKKLMTDLAAGRITQEEVEARIVSKPVNSKKFKSHKSIETQKKRSELNAMEDKK